MERAVLHINVAHFHAVVACLRSPRLSGRPFAVRVQGGGKIILDVSREAWEAGVRRGMSFDAAKRLCRDLVLINPEPSLYNCIEKAIFEQACRLSPLVERAGPGHLFIDLTGTRRLMGAPADAAERMRAGIRETCRIEPAAGIAANRLVSKIASRVIKPEGLCAVIPGCEEDFMAQLPLAILPGIEPFLLEKLLQFNLNLIRDLLRIPVETLACAIGPQAYSVHRQARGIDDTPVRRAGETTPTITKKTVLTRHTNDDCAVAVALFRLTSDACACMRAAGLAAGKTTLYIKYADGVQVRRTTALSPPVNGDLTLFGRCSELLKKSFTRRVRLTELMLECSDLTFPYGQADLFGSTNREEHLMRALDTIRGVYGKASIRFWGREACAGYH